jgi:hypothetical protein
VANFIKVSFGMFYSFVGALPQVLTHILLLGMQITPKNFNEIVT